jgi:hypothetical protein
MRTPQARLEQRNRRKVERVEWRVGVPQEVAVAANNLRVDAATAEVLPALEAAGARTLLLKGATIARWLYPDGQPRRRYTDVDVLVAPGDDDEAAAALRRLGYAPEVDEASMPSWWREHAVAWRRADDPVDIDVHATIVGVGASRARLWEALAADAVTIDVAGAVVRAPALPARALHLALHAAQDARENARAIEEVALAVRSADEPLWRAAAALAADLDAMGALAAGLRLTAEGAALATRLGLAEDGDPTVRLRAGGAPGQALTVERLARAPRARDRATIVARKLVPPATFMRHWSPLARRGPAGLVLAYFVRPVWVLARTPRALRAWHRARRAHPRPDDA